MLRKNVKGDDALSEDSLLDLNKRIAEFKEHLDSLKISEEFTHKMNTFLDVLQASSATKFDYVRYGLFHNLLTKANVIAHAQVCDKPQSIKELLKYFEVCAHIIAILEDLHKQHVMPEYKELTYFFHYRHNQENRMLAAIETIFIEKLSVCATANELIKLLAEKLQECADRCFQANYDLSKQFGQSLRKVIDKIKYMIDDASKGNHFSLSQSM